MVVGRSWADEVEEDEEEQKEQERTSAAARALERSRVDDYGSREEPAQHRPPPPPPRQPPAPPGDSWRRHDSPSIRAQNNSPYRSSTPNSSSRVPASAPPKVISRDTGPKPRVDGLRIEHRRTTSGGSGLGTGTASLQDAVNLACQDIVQPYFKAIVELMHQMMSSLPAQIPKAVAAAVAAEGGQPATVDTAALQRAMLISMAPLQEQIAQIQRTLAHVPALLPTLTSSGQAPTSFPTRVSADSTTSVGTSLSLSGRQAAAALAARRSGSPPPSATTPGNGGRLSSAGGAAPGSSPASLAATPTQGAGGGGGGGGSSGFAERVRAAAAERAAAATAGLAQGGGTDTDLAAEGGSEDGKDRPAAAAAARQPHKVKAGFQAYRAPARRHEESDTA